MSVELSQAELLREWFTPVREGAEGVDVADRLSVKADIERVSELLSELWFSADYAWTAWSDTDILAVLLQWLPAGADEEMPFLQLAVPGKLAEFIAWLEPVIGRLETQEALATAERGVENPGYARDPIPGTRYYRWAGGEYLYSDDQDHPYLPGDGAWLGMDDRIAAQDPASPHYDPGTDRWRRPAEGGVYEYQDRDDREWERSDGASWLRKHSDAAGWLPCDKVSGSWFSQSRWQAWHEVAARAAPGPPSRVIAMHQIPGWEQFEGQPWARDWYALPGAERYSYLHSAGVVPAEDTPGWSDIPPAPPPEPARAREAAAAAETVAEHSGRPRVAAAASQKEKLFEIFALPGAESLSTEEIHEILLAASQQL